VKALFFGESGRQLFGVYHAPRAGAARDAGVVLCYPGAQEYNMAHWAFRKLAGMLAREGFHVLRFDYRGTGDSAGGTDEGNPALWVEDVRLAVTELRDMAGVRPISLVGMRLGASLAVRACAEGLSVRDLVLWEPTVTGTEYLADLDAMDRRRNLLLLHPRTRSAAPVCELFGFPVTPELRGALETIDLRRTAKLPARRTFIIAPGERPQYPELRDALAKTSSGEVQLQIVSDDAGTDGPEREAAILSNRILVAMTQALSRKAAA
jgi:alpha-beta hydrolase superfamily lysophospholipase